MIGSLLYLKTSWSDIMLSVCLCAGFQGNLKESHMMAMKKIIKYIEGTCDYGLWYPRGTYFDLCAYMDWDYARSRNDRKSTSAAF